MNDYLIIFFAIFLTTFITYIAYKILWNVEKENKELQITPEEIAQQIKILLKQKKYDIVENLAVNYLKNKTFCHDVRVLLAKSYFESGKMEKAIEQIKFVIKYNPKNTEYRLFLANCYRTMKRAEDAIEALKKILEYDSNNSWIMKNIAVLYMETNQKFSAIKMYEKMLDFIDNMNEKIETKTILADLYTSINDNRSAIKNYKDILEIFPDDILTKMALCEAYERVQDFNSVLSLANNIFENVITEKDSLWALQKLLKTYKILGDFNSALEIAQKINENSVSDKVKARDDIAQILVEIGRSEEGINIWNDLISEIPSNINLKKNLATAYLRNNDFETAIAIYKKAIEDTSTEVENIGILNAELSSIYANWGTYLFQNGEVDECFKKFNIALGYNTDNPIIYWKLGCIDKEINNYKGAIDNFKKSLDLDSQNINYYYAIAECYEAMDGVYEQKKYLTESLKLDDTNPIVYYKLGLNYEQQNDPINAQVNLEKAVELDSNFVDAKLKLALMYEHKGMIEEAVALYEDILRIQPDNEEVMNNLHMLGK